MPAVELPPVETWIPAPATTTDLDWANLDIADFSKYYSPDGRAELVDVVRKAMTTRGFFFIINHGYTQPETDRMFDIANVPFSQVKEEERAPFTYNIREVGSLQGYKPRTYWKIDNGVPDQMEHYNINRDVTKKPHPEVLRQYLPEIKSFAKFNHTEVLDKVLRLMSLGMEMPEDTLSKVHRYEAEGESYARFMKYYPRSPEDEEKTKNIWLKGHTDFGSVTLLWSQPVSALQALQPDGTWKWVEHIPNAIVVNAGDMIEFLCGGFYKTAIHRVHQPPVDQGGYQRLGVYYFSMADNDARLVPFSDSPALQRAGIKRRFEDKDAPTAESWRRVRTSAYGHSEKIFGTKTEDKGKIEEEEIQGVKVQHWN
jgi:isopenicillin N synthase-like dioxygenase